MHIFTGSVWKVAIHPVTEVHTGVGVSIGFQKEGCDFLQISRKL
jgi:hypothetical protein